MIRIMIHIPVNVRSWLVNYIMDNQQMLEEKIGDEIAIFTPHDEEYASDVCDQWLPQAIKNDIVPDIAISMAAEYAFSGKENLSDVFGKFAGFLSEKKKIRKEFISLIDDNQIFYPFSITPLTMLYNTQTVDESDLKHSWTDLFNPKFRIIFPDRDKPLCRAVGAYLKANYPEDFVDFEKRVTYDGSPASVGKSLTSGEYDIAMTLSTFAEVAQNEIIGINNPQEGKVCMPQIITCKKGSEKKIEALLDFVTCDEIQEYLESQGIWTIREEGKIADNLEKNDQLSKWKDWKTYLSEIYSFVEYKNK